MATDRTYDIMLAQGTQRVLSKKLPREIIDRIFELTVKPILKPSIRASIVIQAYGRGLLARFRDLNDVLVKKRFVHDFLHRNELVDWRRVTERWNTGTRSQRRYRRESNKGYRWNKTGVWRPGPSAEVRSAIVNRWFGRISTRAAWYKHRASWLHAVKLIDFDRHA